MTCLDNNTKSAIINKIEHSNIASNEAQILAEFIEELPVCSITEPQKGKKSMRPLSKYNIFLSSCLKDTHMHSKKTMSECIPLWREVKQCIQNGGTFEGCKSQKGY